MKVFIHIFQTFFFMYACVLACLVLCIACVMLLFFFFWPVYGLLVPQAGIEPAPSAVKTLSPNHWTTKEFPRLLFI